MSDTTNRFYFIKVEITEPEAGLFQDWLNRVQLEENLKVLDRDHITSVTGIPPPPFPSVDGILLELGQQLTDKVILTYIMNEKETGTLISILEGFINDSEELYEALKDCKEYLEIK